MTLPEERRSRIRSTLLTILAFSVSCYCLGAVVLQGASLIRPTKASPTPTIAPATDTPQATRQITWEFRTQTPSMEPSATATWTPSVTYTPFHTPTPTITPTPSPTATFTITFTPSDTATEIPPSDTPLPSDTPQPTDTLQPSNTPVITQTTELAPQVTP